MERVSYGGTRFIFSKEKFAMYKKRDATAFDAAVERVMSEVLRRLENGDTDLTIAVGDGDYLLSEDDLLRDLTIFSDEVFDGETVREPSAVVVKFRNGQTFRIMVKENSGPCGIFLKKCE